MTYSTVDTLYPQSRPLHKRNRTVAALGETQLIDLSSSVLYVGWLCAVATFFVYRYLTMYGDILDSTSLWLILLVAGIHMVRAVFIRQDPMSPDVFFVLFFTAFHFFGHVVMEMGFTYRDTFLVPYVDELNPALLYSAAFLVLFLIGYEVRNLVHRQVVIRPMVPVSPLLTNLAQMIFYLSLVMMLIGVARSGGRVLSVQYENSMYTEGATLFREWAVGKGMATLAIFIYVAASIHAGARLFQNRAFLVLVVIYLGVVFMSGKRGGFLAAALPPLFLYHHFVRRIRLLWLGLGLLGFIMVIPALRYMRADAGSYSLSRLAEGISQTESPILQTAAEAGGSYRVVNATMHYVKTDGLQYGKSYFAAIAKIVPFLGGWAANNFGWISPAQWITLRHQGGGGGMGGSIAMEAYLNFGLWGLFIAVIVGYLYRSLYERALCAPTILKTFLFCAATLGLISFSRGGLGSLTRPLVWGTLMIIMLDRAAR